MSADLPFSGYLVPPVLGVFVLTGVALYSLQTGREKKTCRLFALLCAMGALINADLVVVSVLADGETALLIDRFTCVAFIFGVPVYMQFIHSFLGIRNRPKWEMLVYGAGFLFALTVPAEAFLLGFHESPFGRIGKAGTAFYAFSFYATAVVSYTLYLLFRALRDAPDSVARHRIRYVLGGVSASVVLLSLNILPVWGIPIYPPGHFSFIPAVVLAYGILKYDLLGVGAFVRKGAVYLVLTTMLAASYFLLISVFHFFFLAASWERSLLLPLILALAVVFLFHPLKALLERLVDRLFFRGRYDYRKLLRELSGRLASLLDVSSIHALLTDTVLRALQVRYVRLVLMEQTDRLLLVSGGESVGAYPADGEEPAVPYPLLARLLEQGKPLSKSHAVRTGSEPAGEILSFFDRTGAAWVIPLISKGVLIGSIVLGEKKSGELFVREDIELLATLANQAATAIENAKNYEEIKRLNCDLEGRVEQRTADLRRALDEKDKTQRQLIQSESLAAIGQLVAGTAHEMNNPLASASSLLQTAIETLGDGIDEDGTGKEVVDDLRFALRELGRAAEIVRSLLGLSRQTRVFEENVHIHRVLDDALRVLHNQYKNRRVEIEKRYEENLPEIRGNFANLGQVFINLVKNSIQAVQDRPGRIVLKTWCDPAGRDVSVEVEDNGIGMAEEILKDIFKPFFTTKEVGEGTGLGLYISHEIVRRHGGVIHVRSERNVGSAFTVTIPVGR